MKSIIRKSVIIITILLWIGVAVNYRAIADSYSKKSKENTKKQENISKTQPGESDQRKNELIKLGLDEKTVEKVLEVESEIGKIKCDYKELEKYFYKYYKYFTNSPEERWDVVQKKHTCNKVLSRIITLEKNIYQPHFTFLPVKNGFGEKPVVLYGKIVFPPYEIKYDDDAIKAYLNGVQIIPALRGNGLPKTNYELKNPHWAEFHEKLEVAERTFQKEFINQMRQEAINKYKKYGYTKEVALQELKGELEQFKKNNTIQDYWVYDEENFLFDVKIVYSHPNWPNVPLKMQYTADEWEELTKDEPDFLLSKTEREEKRKVLFRKKMRDRIQVLKSCVEYTDHRLIDIVPNGESFPSFHCHFYKKDLLDITYAILSKTAEWKKVLYVNRLNLEDRSYILYNTDKSSALRFIQTNSN